MRRYNDAIAEFHSAIGQFGEIWRVESGQIADAKVARFAANTVRPIHDTATSVMRCAADLELALRSLERLDVISDDGRI